MPRFHVYVVETVGYSITVDADNKEDAENKIYAGEWNPEDESEKESDGVVVEEVELAD